MKKVFGLMFLMLSLLVFNERAAAQCNQVTKIYEKYYGIAAGLESFKSQIDKDNNTYIVGCYRTGTGNVFDLGNGMVLPDIGNANHVLLIKFNRNAKPLWYKLIKTNDINSLPYITIDSLGYVYITSMTAYPISIENINLYLKFEDGFIMKFSPEGKALWVRGMVGHGLNGNSTVPISIAITPKANLYVSGLFQGDTVFFDNLFIKKPSINTTTNNLFIAKYDSSGKVQWALAEGCSDPSKQVQVDFTRLCSDEDDNVYVAGQYKGYSTDIKLGKFIITKGYDSVVLFIAKYSKNGVAVWAKIIKTEGYLKPNDFVYDGKGSLFLSFQYDMESRIDSFSFGGPGTQKLGLIRMDTSGSIHKTRNFYSIGFGNQAQYANLQTLDLKIDKQGNLYFGGVAGADSINFDNYAHRGDTSSNRRFSFTVKTDPDFNAIWAYFQDQYNFYEENDCISIDDSGKVNLIVATPSMFAGYGKFYFTQFRNNFSVFPNVLNGNKCYEDQKGGISLRMLEGKRPYVIQWQGGYGSDSILTGLKGGDYRVAVTDANGCVQNLSIKVPTAPELKIDATVKNDYRSRQEGQVTLKVSGGTPPYKFQWNDPLHQTTQNAVVLFAGTYKVTITDHNGCVYDSTFTVLNITGIDDLCGSKALVYPNPVTDGQLSIEIQQLPENMSLSLYDGMGREVLSRNVAAGSSFNDQLNLSTKGIYILKMEMGGKVVVRKVVVE